MEEFFYSNYLLLAYVVIGGLVFFLAFRPLHAIDREDLTLLGDFLGPRLAFFGEWRGRFWTQKQASDASRSNVLGSISEAIIEVSSLSLQSASLNHSA